MYSWWYSHSNVLKNSFEWLAWLVCIRIALSSFECVLSNLLIRMTVRFIWMPCLGCFFFFSSWVTHLHLTMLHHALNELFFIIDSYLPLNPANKYFLYFSSLNWLWINKNYDKIWYFWLSITSIYGCDYKVMQYLVFWIKEVMGSYVVRKWFIFPS